MSIVVVHLLALTLGFAICRALLPVIIRTAWRFGWLDVPDRDRRHHTAPVPRLGGVAIIASVAITFSLMLWWTSQRGMLPRLPLPMQPILPGVLIGGLLVFILGIFDDLRGVSPRVKLVVQVIAALIVVSYGFLPTRFAISAGAPAGVLGDYVALAITVLWIVGVTNAVNLVDGIDGLAGTVIVVALAVALLAEWIGGQTVNVTLSMATLGAVFAFLSLNWRPARVFLGDSGSMSLGFFLAVRTVYAATDVQTGVTYPLVPLFALAFPLLDTFVAMARRFIRKHPFSRADGRHIHHQLVALGFSVQRTVEVIAITFAALGIFAVAVVFAPARMAVALALAGAVMAFALLVYGVRFLRYVEFMEVGSSMASIIRNARTVVHEKLVVNEVLEQMAKATSYADVRMRLEEVVHQTEILDLDIVPHGTAPRVPPVGADPRQHTDAVLLEFPLAWVVGERVHRASLRLWSPRTARATHHVAERIASRVGPALEAWFITHQHTGPAQRDGTGRELRLG